MLKTEEETARRKLRGGNREEEPARNNAVRSEEETARRKQRGGNSEEETARNNAVRSELLRRVGDSVVASVLLVLSAPLLVIALLATFFESGRPLFFGHVRVGRGGSLYRCWKVRTMQYDAETRLHE